ncbi:efflux RND transporter permease subunit [Parvularcula sp. ZS-1/3]|uniref:Efflux RND transporter permease subunit n=1 Tax=Parvularcula mediterranea TaxID=2732508 RepID=A0A7Y3RL76_9PROT|nr:efflux RND transporter permease subunit [Parvularcula mediterranea]NNU16154.1 efflux RND transporter permease subunit [Parvularcula mediterranea]
MRTLLFDNPRALAMALILVFVGGVAALLTMPQQEDPKIRNRAATILTALPGASAERVERLVTQVIEDQIRELEEVDIVSSTSNTGLSSVSVILQDSINETDKAFSKVRDSLSDAAVLLPEGASEPRFIDDRGYAYTVLTALIWDAESEENALILKRSAEELQARLRNVPGTEFTEVHGAGSEEIAVTLRADLAQSLGLSETDIARALAAGDAKVSAGRVTGRENEIAIEVRGELETLDRVRAVPIREGADGATVRIGDIAEVTRGLAVPEQETAFVDGKRALVVGTRIDDGLRVQQWSERVRQEVASFEQDVSSGIEVKIIFDQATYTQERFGNLLTNLGVGVLLVVTILFFTLGPRAALLVTLAIPLTALLSLMTMNFFGVPIHQMSVTGLIVALGLLVDAAIVMCDAVGRALRRGLSPREAVSESVGRLFVPLLSSTATTVLAFLPITLLTGGAGEFVGPIADSVIIALIASFVLSMTVIAALAGRFLSPSQSEEKTSSGGIEFPFIGPAFKGLLGLSLAAPRLSILAALVLPVFGFIGVGQLPTQFFPAADRNQFHVQITLPPQSSLQETKAALRDADAFLTGYEGIETVEWFAGNSVPAFYYNLMMNRDGAANFAEAMVTTTELGGIKDLINDLQTDLSTALPQAQINVRVLVQGPPTPAPFELRIQGRDLDTLRELGEKARLILSEVPEVTVSTASLAGGEPKLWLDADEEAARLAGLSLRDIAGGLAAKLQGTPAGTVIEGDSEVPVTVRLDDRARSSIEAVSSLSLSGRSSSAVGTPLASLGELKLEPSAASITRYEGERVNTILAYTDADALPSAAVDAFMLAIEEGRFDIPPGYSYAFGGDAEARSDAVGALLASVGLIVTAVVAVVVLTFSSFRLGGVVLIVAGLSMGLGMLSLYIAGYPFGFQPIIALMGLMGVAINAAIIIIATLKAKPEAVAGDRLAVRDGVMETSRHITSTTLTTFAGFLPLILAEGGFWPPFATAIAGGVVLSTVVSFFFVPQLFLLLTRQRPVARFDLEETNGDLIHAPA